MIKYFRISRPFLIFLIPLVFILIWIPSIFKEYNYYFSFDILPGLIYSSFKETAYNWTVFFTIFTILILISTGFILIRLNIVFFFIPFRTQLPLLFFLAINSSFLPLQRFTPVIIINLLILWILYKIFNSYQQKGISYKYFDTALILSLSTFLYQNAAFFIVLIWTGLIIMRNNTFREWIFTIIGFILPYMFYYSWFFITGSEIKYMHISKEMFFTNYTKIPGFNNVYIYYWLFLVLMVIITSFYMIINFNIKKIHSRKILLVFFWYFLLTVLLYFLVPSVGIEVIIFISVPLSFLFTNYFVYVKRNIVNELLFILILVGSIFVSIYNYYILK